MRTLLNTMPLLLFTILMGGAALAQTTHVRHHPNPNVPIVIGSTPGMGLPGGADPSAKSGPSAKLSEAGDVAAQKGDWQTARSKYQDALDLWSDNALALYGLAKCAENDGDTAAAIGYYRTAIYSHDPKVYGSVPGDGYRTNDVGRMMEYVLLLSQTHQDTEAQKVYKRAAYVLNYQDSKFTGKPFLKVLLPEFGPGPGQIAYTPQRLQAMAHVTLSILSAGFDGKAAMPEIQKAVQLYPDSPVAYYYLGERLYAKSDKGAKAAYEKAAQLGGPQVGAAAQDALKNCR
jgi:tetratricopeptide (TPR) repeat protein